jgi:hypothetical protein
LKAKLLYSILKNALAYYNAGVVAVNSKVVGLAPDRKFSVQTLWINGLLILVEVVGLEGDADPCAVARDVQLPERFLCALERFRDVGLLGSILQNRSDFGRQITRCSTTYLCMWYIW